MEFFDSLPWHLWSFRIPFFTGVLALVAGVVCLILEKTLGCGLDA